MGSITWRWKASPLKIFNQKLYLVDTSESSEDKTPGPVTDLDWIQKIVKMKKNGNGGSVSGPGLWFQLYFEKSPHFLKNLDL